MEQKFLDISLQEMPNVAKRVAELVKPGDVVFLEGDLGAGKTTLVRETAEYFGVIDQVTSPSFALVNVYRCDKFSIAHFDLYRLSSAEDLQVIGGDEFLNEDYLLFVEWPEHGVDFFPNPEHTIKIELSEDAASRSITIISGDA